MTVEPNAAMGDLADGSDVKQMDCRFDEGVAGYTEGKRARNNILYNCFVGWWKFCTFARLLYCTQNYYLA
ncbi:MAG: hypothetical protein SPI30_01885 [Prevotella sp.]|nr:hypothetical protein [Prevotella sp.]